ncbi:MAG: hypothetical protein RLZZ628_965 [Bacteroidota bacterium]|jgi:hypothetical protein
MSCGTIADFSGGKAGFVGMSLDFLEPIKFIHPKQN